MRVKALFAFGLMLASGTAAAHHNFFAEFDADKPVTLTGTVTKLEWTNPHTWTRKSMNIGDIVTVEGFLARDKPNIANARVVTLTATGQRLFAASSAGQQP